MLPFLDHIFLGQLPIPISDPEKNPSARDLDSLQPPSHLLQAVLLLEPSATSTLTIDEMVINTGSMEDEERNMDIIEKQRLAGSE